jgi:hypothetical protein
MNVTQSEYQTLIEGCKNLPKPTGHTLINDYLENLLYTVLDFRMQGQVVERSVNHYRHNVPEQAGIKDFESIKALLTRYPNDREGNRQAAQFLWGNNHWTRVELLRRFIQYFESQGIKTQVDLREWARRVSFERDFKGKVRGAGLGIFKWLVMRQGVETIKPDVWVHRFIEETIGRRLKNEEAVEVLENVAQEVGVGAYNLDLAIWEYRRNRK